MGGVAGGGGAHRGGWGEDTAPPAETARRHGWAQQACSPATLLLYKGSSDGTLVSTEWPDVSRKF